MGVVTRASFGLLLTLVLAASGCEPASRCGDGFVDDDEACDDSNLASGDGCSASCELDDDSSTPGDDRPGYFVCSAPLEPELGITCGPGTVCCLTNGPVCMSTEEGCFDVFNVVSCDGPEDCSAATHCETLTHGTSCTFSEGAQTWCHTDEDCVPFVPWFESGTCSATGACDWTLVPPDEVEL